MTVQWYDKLRKKKTAYREPMAVREIFYFRNSGSFPVCPRCHISLEREYVNYCDRCGQRLDWKYFDAALVHILP